MDTSFNDAQCHQQLLKPFQQKNMQLKQNRHRTVEVATHMDMSIQSNSVQFQ